MNERDAAKGFAFHWEEFFPMLSANFINAFNHVNLNAPATALGGNMGVVNSSQDPRNIQLALKFYF